MLFTLDLGTKRSTSGRSSMSTLWEDHEARHKSTLEVNMTPNNPRTIMWNLKLQGLRRKIQRLGRQDILTIEKTEAHNCKRIEKTEVHSCKRSSQSRIQNTEATQSRRQKLTTAREALPWKMGPKQAKNTLGRWPRRTGPARFCGGSDSALY
jgi:hypothetical protein